MARGGIPWVSLFKRNGKWRAHVACRELGIDYHEVIGTDYKLARTWAMTRSLEIDRQRLGLLDPAVEGYAEARKQLLTRALDKLGGGGAKEREGHLEEFRDVLVARGRLKRYARDQYQKILTIANACNAAYLHDLTPTKVQRAVADLEASHQTRNHYIAALKNFYNWLVEDGRIPINPFQGRVKRYNVATDRRRCRRIITEEELARLLAAAEAGPLYIPFKQGNKAMDGPTRADVYRVCLGTAQRADEVRRMCVRDVVLEGEGAPYVRIEAKRAKNRREAVQIISGALAGILRQYVEGRDPGEPVFKLPKQTAAMLRFDLEAAGIPYETDAGVFDFHSLRYQSGAAMIARGVNVKVIQEHMRHSSITLTMDRYGKPQLHDQVSAANAIPLFEQPKTTEIQRATGTTDAPSFIDRPTLDPPFSSRRTRMRLDRSEKCSFANRRLGVQEPPVAFDVNPPADVPSEPQQGTPPPEAAPAGHQQTLQPAPAPTPSHLPPAQASLFDVPLEVLIAELARRAKGGAS